MVRHVAIVREVVMVKKKGDHGKKVALVTKVVMVIIRTLVTLLSR